MDNVCNHGNEKCGQEGKDNVINVSDFAEKNRCKIDIFCPVFVMTSDEDTGRGGEGFRYIKKI